MTAIRIRFLVGAIGGVLALLCLPGCIGVMHTPYQPDNGNPDVILTGYHEPRLAHTPALRAPRETALINVQENYDKVLLEFPPVAGIGRPPVEISAYYYRSKVRSAGSAVIVLPVWGSYRYPSRKMVKTLRRRSKGDLHVIQVIGEEPLIDWEMMRGAETEAEFMQIAKDMAGRVADMVTGLRQIIDWAEAEPQIDPDRIGMVGFSVSAIIASVVLGMDERLSAGVMMMGAANPGEVFATCRGEPGRVRKSVMQRFGWSRDYYQALFEQLFGPGDPVNFSGRYRPERLLIIDGVFDKCMSRDARQALWIATGRPERVRFLAQHKWAFLAMTPFAMNIAGKKIADFMERVLEREPMVTDHD